MQSRMGRPLRCQEAGNFYFVSSRCLEARFLLRPDPEVRTLSGLWLARALARWPALTLHGAIVMSNHLHLLLRDGEGELAAFAGYYLGNLARAVNRFRGREGPVFHARYDAVRVLDPRAAVDYLEYLITNPVRAGLVDRHEQWPGLLLYAGNTPKREEFVWREQLLGRRDEVANRGQDRRHKARGDFEQRASLDVFPLPFALNGDTPTLLGGRSLLALDPAALFPGLRYRRKTL
jgi:REP element-mobilizing transposase RayT